MKQAQAKPYTPVFPRAAPVALAQFDPRTKVCTMNCGRHKDDPRSNKECKFLCTDCMPAYVGKRS